MVVLVVLCSSEDGVGLSMATSMRWRSYAASVMDDTTKRPLKTRVEDAQPAAAERARPDSTAADESGGEGSEPIATDRPGPTEESSPALLAGVYVQAGG